MPSTEKPIDKAPSESVAPESVTIDALTETEHFPDVQEHAVKTFEEKQAAQIALEKQTAALENAGIKMKKDGTPAAKRGRKPNAQKQPSSVLKTPRQNVALTPNVDSTQAALIVSGILETMQVTLISDEFKYTDTERALNVDAWRKSLDYYGGVSVSPPMELAISHAAIILSRAQQPKTQSKFALMKAWAADKISTYKAQKKKAKENASTDNRSDAIGENDLREKESGGAKKDR
jgi:hypothetical protein